MIMEVDITIIGVGPAGLQAAIHAARRKVKVVAVGKNDSSALNKAEVENYLGIVKMSGEDPAHRP
jgi:thioredoxin reductase (NADPH)